MSSTSGPSSGPLSTTAYKLFAGSANPELAEKVSEALGIPLGKATVGRFNDGECNIQLGENVRNTHVFLVQSTCPPVNDAMMELFLMVRCFRRASARTVTAIVPYYGYARQDRKTTARVPISASDVAMLLEAAGVDRMLSVDLHCGQIQGFFHHAPVDNLHAFVEHVPFMVKEIIPSYGENPIAIVSPDAGGAHVDERSQHLAGDHHQASRQGGRGRVVPPSPSSADDLEQVEGMNIVGEIKGKHCIIVDDMIDTAGTLCKSADSLREMGALSVSACCTHALFSGPALDRIGKSSLKHVIVADTIPISKDVEEGSPAAFALKEKIKVVSCARLLAQAILSINCGTSVSGSWLFLSSLFAVSKTLG
ncbi:hypothetical protein GUITHDRAFT_148758 [Guillardia theta CCMP2712]|uniref:ribose-phosphate diphosphokinase n=1 Tax=Guillardia theta (strain CCMP2712) TaxID=905079 RepID=L1I7P3_GUITC|nr:hypothetical protein GUITHDRAFT_148758 [Guillardia theta CCMP2712]EKX32253.1 hypothetical protein GUITHDRAFT_148758 [Guillardia theta CCMP2712]|eukprot:XP_005819233.1 hypothetical protein GUITHDRAFT_148758 [Guillardia theta CCMP2712]